MGHSRFVIAAALFAARSIAPAVAEDAASWAVTAGVRYGIVSDQTYLIADGTESKLDLWVPRGATAPAPTVIYIHGGDHAVRLHAALDRAGVANQVHTIEGGGHGGFTVEQALEAYGVIREFLARHVPAPTS